MPKLRNMLGETGSVEIPVPGDDPLVVAYRRDILTPRMQARMALFQAATPTDATGAADALDFFCDVYGKLIDSWNLTNDDGSTIGTDAEALKDVPLDVLTLIAREIGRTTTPDPLSESVSNNGSSPRAGLEPLRTTTA